MSAAIALISLLVLKGVADKARKHRGGLTSIPHSAIRLREGFGG